MAIKLTLIYCQMLTNVHYPIGIDPKLELGTIENAPHISLMCTFGLVLSRVRVAKLITTSFFGEKEILINHLLKQIIKFLSRLVSKK